LCSYPISHWSMCFHLPIYQQSLQDAELLLPIWYACSTHYTVHTVHESLDLNPNSHWTVAASSRNSLKVFTSWFTKPRWMTKMHVRLSIFYFIYIYNYDLWLWYFFFGLVFEVKVDQGIYRQYSHISCWFILWCITAVAYLLLCKLGDDPTPLAFCDQLGRCPDPCWEVIFWEYYYILVPFVHDVGYFQRQ